MSDTEILLLKRTLSNYKPLSRDDEVELGRTMRHDQSKAERRSARDKLILSNARFALKEAHRASRWSRSEFMDLLQEAMTALVDAADRWDPERGYTFCTYASWRIKSRLVRRSMKDYSIVNSITSLALRYNFGLKHKLELLTQQGLTEDEALDRLSIDSKFDKDELSDALEVLRHTVLSLDKNIVLNDEGGSVALVDALTDHSSKNPEEQVTENELYFRSLEILRDRCLLSPDRSIPICKHRLLTSDPVPLASLGVKLGLSAERVRQLEAALIASVRCVLDSRALEVAA